MNKVVVFKITQLLRICFGSIFILSGLLGVIIGIFGIIDPVGAKMADDADPFGVPDTFSESLNITCFYGLIFLFGMWLVLRSKLVRKSLSRITFK